MIAVDTSALLAILQSEAFAEPCKAAIGRESQLVISAGTVAEALIVARLRDLGPEMARLIDVMGFEVIRVIADSARRIGAAYARWGKGVHPAGLNFGDCFAYDVARHLGCPLLFVGDDFARTDVLSALASGADPVAGP